MKINAVQHVLRAMLKGRSYIAVFCPQNGATSQIISALVLVNDTGGKYFLKKISPDNHQ